MKKVGKWIVGIVIVAIIAFVVYAVIMAYNTSQEWTITIRFNNDVAAEIQVENDQTVQISDLLSQIEIEGYEPVALYDNAELSGEPLQGSLTINDDLTLYLSCDRLLNLRLVYDDQVINLYGKDGESVTNPLTPTKEHARFLGWTDGENIILSDENVYTYSSDDFQDYLYVLTAKFEDALLVTFEPNGGEPIENQYLFSGQTLHLPTCKREHYVFTGWLVNGQTYQAGSSLVITQSQSIRAQWRAETYYLVYQNEDGQEIATISVNYNQTVNLRSQQTASEGHYASGWLINGELHQDTYTIPDIGNDGDTIFATSTYDIENYTIRFAGTYNESYNNIQVQYGDTVTLPTPTREGYTFTGWSYGGSLYSGRYQVADLGSNNANVAFTAIWQGNDITLTFDYGEGTVQSGKVDSIDIIVGDIINSGDLPSPVYAEPYTFEGWYLDENFTTAISYGSTNNLTENTTLYAKISQSTDITAFGSGTQEDPYRIYNGEQLNAFYSAGTTGFPVRPGEYIEFMNDIVMSGNFSTQPTGRVLNINIEGNNFSLTINKPLADTFQGNLSNLSIYYSPFINVNRDSRIALFSSNEGTINNVTIAEQNITLNMDFSVTSYYPSLLVRFNYNLISNCTSYANIEINGATNRVPCFAVFVGQNEGVITDCQNYGDITTSGDVDVGVFAYLNAAEISNCSNKGDIYAYSVGVIANRHSSSTANKIKITNCEVRGNITSYAAGIGNSSSIFGELRRTNTASQVLTIEISNCRYSTSNLLLITIYEYINDSSDYITDLDTIKTLLPNVDFDSITKI